MKPSRGPSKITLTTLTISYIFFLVFLYIIFIKVLSQLNYAAQIAPALMLFAILVPLTFLVALCLKLYQIYSEKKSGNIATKFKSRVVLFFILIILLGMVPQTGLSIIFLKKVGTTWLPDKTIPTLKKGLKTAFFYYEEKIDALKDFCESPLFVKYINNPNNKIFEYSKLINKDIVAIQINYDDDSLIYGDESLIYKDKNKKTDGPLPRLDLDDRTFLRYNKNFNFAGRNLNTIVTIEVPVDIINSASEFSSLLNYYEKINVYKSNLTTFMIILFVIIFFPLFFIVILLSLFITEEITQPITAIEEASKSIIDGDMSVRIIDKKNSSFGIITNSFNKILAELELQSQLKYEEEKLKVWKDFSEIINKNINENIDSTIKDFNNLIEIEKEKTGNKNFILTLEDLQEKLQNFMNDLNGLKIFSEIKDPIFNTIDICSAINSGINNNNMVNKNITIYFNPQKNYFVNGDIKLLSEMFTQIIKNSIEAIETKGDIFIEINKIRKNNQNYNRIYVSDTGKGIPKDIKSKIFQPYFSTKNYQLGIGLTIIERIVFLHRGNMRLESSNNKTTFFVDIPELSIKG